MIENTAQTAHSNDVQMDRALRPDTFEGFIGQEEHKFNLQVFVSAAKGRGEALDHILLSGPPGLGKTTLAQILANEMGSRLVVVNAPSIKTKGELAGILLGLKKGDILFLDEIHSLKPAVEEILYPAREDFKLEVVAGEGAMANAITMPLEPFTLLGATTRAGMLQRPMRDRFGEIVQMQPYTAEELAIIISGNARKLGLVCESEGALELARRSRGTPRIANRLLRRVRDFAHFEGHSSLNAEIVRKTCERLGIDSAGLDRSSQRYLRLLAQKNSPVGLNVLAQTMGESKDTIEEVIEAHLLRIGFIERGSKGRSVTSAGLRHLYPEN
jgi:Holliday junction DNA helicase RuvB